MTGNGLWIRDKLDLSTNYINAEKIENDNLLDVSISQFDENFNLKNYNLKKAKIKDNNWLLEDVVVNTDNFTEKYEQVEFYSNFNIKKFYQFLKIFRL